MARKYHELQKKDMSIYIRRDQLVFLMIWINQEEQCLHARVLLRIRIITPKEAERMQGFNDDWTLGMPERKRYFCMGNALVVPMITRMGKVLDDII